MANQNLNESKDNRRFITPAGAAAAAICFFLPWMKLSCVPNKTISGADLGGIFWIVFACAMIALIVYMIFASQRKLAQSKPLVILSSLVGLGIIVYKYLELQNGMKTPLGTTVKPKDIGLELQSGFYGTIIGFIIALIGTAFLKTDNISEKWIPNKSAGESYDEESFCSDCGTKLLSGDHFCAECGTERIA